MRFIFSQGTQIGEILFQIIFPQAYTSQFISLVMFGLMMSEDRISLQQRRREIIQGLKDLPGEQFTFHFIKVL